MTTTQKNAAVNHAQAAAVAAGRRRFSCTRLPSEQYIAFDVARQFSPSRQEEKHDENRG
jgi:hypothetical protein